MILQPLVCSLIVQKMVVSLATDKNVWESVLANEQIKEFRQKLRESTGTLHSSRHNPTSPLVQILNAKWRCFRD